MRHHGRWFTLGASHVEFGRGKAGGQAIEQRVRIRHLAHNLQQAAAGVSAIVKAKPALFEEDVAAHLAAQGRIQLAHLGLDQRVAGFEHQRHATGSRNGRGQALRAFDVKHNGAAGHAREHVLCKQHHLPVGEDVAAIAGDDAQTVAVAVKGQAEFSVASLESGNQIAQVFGLAGVGVVVGKIAVHFAKQLGHLAANGAQNGRGRSAGHAVAAVHHDFQGARQANVAHDFCGVGGQYVRAGARAAALQRPGFVHHHLAQGLDFVAVNGFAPHHHLESVVVARVVAASHLDAAITQGAGRKVQHGRGDHAHVNHLHAHVLQTAHQRCGKKGAAQTPVPAHGHSGLALAQRKRAKGAAQTQGDFFIDGGRDDAPNVIGFENGG